MPTSCKNCGNSFSIRTEDLALLEKLAPVIGAKKEVIPPPTLCPECRMRRRMAYRNERALYHRKCDLTGKQIISQYSVDKPFKIYEIGAWHTDQWDALSYGRVFDPSCPFSEQFQELRIAVPRMSLVREGTNVNSDYCNRASNVKDCYLIFSSNRDENCYYSINTNDSRDCCDCYNVQRSELMYQCVDCYDSYNCRYCEGCRNCSDSAFLRHCNNCRHCLFCTNLVSKEYCIFNKQYTKERYEAELESTMLGRSSTVALLAEKFLPMKQGMIVKFFLGMNNENSSGNCIVNCKNVHDSFDCLEVEDGAYLQSIVGAKDCMDYSYWGVGTELIYETHACGLQCQRMLFCNECWEGNSDLLYCDSCIGAKHCFGCVGLQHQQYCILNKQYTKEDYEKLVPQIIAAMRKDGTWGEFFPIEKSLFAYNETVAQDYFPLTKEVALKQGLSWQEHQETIDQYLGPDYDIPDNIHEVSDDITKQILRCEVTGKPFKVIPQELKFYRDMGIAIPRKSPDQRHRERLSLRSPRKLWSRACMKCKAAIQTSYAPNRPEQVYCESCYLSTVR